MQKKKASGRSDAAKPAVPFFGRTAVKLGLISSGQLNDALKVYESAQEKGSEKKLGQVMVELGLLTREQVRQILLAQKKDILACLSCGAQFNVPRIDIEEIKAKACAKCGGRLESPRELSTVFAEETGRLAEAVKTGKFDLKERQEKLLEDIIGKEIGNCTIISKIGEGGMGVVYKAVHKRIKREVALKVLPRC